MIRRLCLRDARHDPLGENQNVHRCLRIDVADGQHMVVFKHDFRWDFPCDDFFKEGFHGVSIDNFELLVQADGGGERLQLKRKLFHDQRALGFLRVPMQALAQIFDDLILQLFAAGAPPAGTGQLLDAAAQAVKTQHARRLLEA